jgi:Flp pilus assembly pilin Flp
MNERGQTAAEYAVVLGLITIAVVTTIATMSGVIVGMFQAALDVVS